VKRDPLLNLGRQKLLELRSQLETVRASITLLKTEGLVAAKGTAIDSYKAQGSNGDYYDYYKLIKGKNETLIHLGHEISQGWKFFALPWKGDRFLMTWKNSEPNSQTKSINSKVLSLTTMASLSKNLTVRFLKKKAIAFLSRRRTGSNPTTRKAIAL